MLRVPLNKGVFYENNFVGPQPADIFRGIKLLQLVVVLFSGWALYDGILMYLTNKHDFLIFEGGNCAFTPWLRACHVTYHLALIHSTCNSSLQSEL